MHLSRHEAPHATRILGASIFTATLTIGMACGKTEETISTAPAAAIPEQVVTDGATGAPNATVTSDSGALVDGSPTPDVCLDASAPAPDGGACDWSRIRTSGLAQKLCIGLGVFCDTFQFSFSPADDGDPPIPAGFTCTVELGVKTCSYQNGAGPKLNLDAASLSAACEVTTRLPKAVVSCIVYD